MERIIHKPAKSILGNDAEVVYTAAELANTKTEAELEYWSKLAQEGPLGNKHFKYFFTTNFKLNEDFYNNKRILDIGCGPRGSLEWADMASVRIGLDPLADSYQQLGANQHKMIYVASPAEKIPFPKNYFDVVSSFNSLDHVDNLDQTIKEIIRIVAPGGNFLLTVEVNHPPTRCEPISFSWDVTRKFFQDLDLLTEKHFESIAGGIYKSVTTAIPYEHNNPKSRTGVLVAHFRKPI